MLLSEEDKLRIHGRLFEKLYLYIYFRFIIGSGGKVMSMGDLMKMEDKLNVVKILFI